MPTQRPGGSIQWPRGMTGQMGPGMQLPRSGQVPFSAPFGVSGGGAAAADGGAMSSQSVGAGGTAQAGPGGGGDAGGALAGAPPGMIGDLLGGFILVRPRGGSSSGSSGLVTGSARRSGVRAPLASRGPFKIAENESPRPIDRSFITFNYFDDVSGFGLGGPTQVYRGMIGFEKTIFDGNASLGVRLPFQQASGEGDVGVDGFGDLSLILKYAFVNDRRTGNLISGGLVLTVPTGVSPDLLDSGTKINAVLFQPWAGAIYNLDPRVYVHGFTSFIFSTEDEDVSLYALDVGVGYRAYQAEPGSVGGGGASGIFTSITPTLEAHLTAPLRTTNSHSSLIYFPDVFAMTGGVHLGLAHRALLTLGLVVPMSGPQVYDWEFVCQLNCRY